MRIALCIEYNGGPFHGWQTQPGGGTVQDALEAALTQIASEPIAVVCAGRTDAGVHATAQIVHFDCYAERPLTAWVRGTNALLPESVSVRWAHLVDSEFHARFSAFSRRYRYLLLNREQRPGLAHGKVGWFHRPLDLLSMQEAAENLQGEHDFSSFRAAECQAHSPVRNLREASVRQDGDVIIFDFEANAFLHHMVRNMVGSLVYIGNGKHAPGWISELIAAKNRSVAAPTFSAAGLYLAGVGYEPRWGLPAQPLPVLSGC